MASGGETIAPNRNPIGHAKIHEPMRCGSDRNRCKNNATHCQKRNRAQIKLKLAPTHQEGRGINDGRQNQEQHELRSELYRWQAGHKRQQNTREYQKDGWWDFESVRNDGYCRNDGQ